MKKQYTFREISAFKTEIILYHNGYPIIEKILWDDEAYGYIEKIEEEGYKIGYHKEDAEKAKQRYENIVANLIEGDKND